MFRRGRQVGSRYLRFKEHWLAAADTRLVPKNRMASVDDPIKAFLYPIAPFLLQSVFTEVTLGAQKMKYATKDDLCSN